MDYQQTANAKELKIATNIKCTFASIDMLHKNEEAKFLLANTLITSSILNKVTSNIQLTSPK
jgi:hypothetical protein